MSDSSVSLICRTMVGRRTTRSAGRRLPSGYFSVVVHGTTRPAKCRRCRPRKGQRESPIDEAVDQLQDRSQRAGISGKRMIEDGLSGRVGRPWRRALISRVPGEAGDVCRDRPTRYQAPPCARHERRRLPHLSQPRANALGKIARHDTAFGTTTIAIDPRRFHIRHRTAPPNAGGSFLAISSRIFGDHGYWPRLTTASRMAWCFRCAARRGEIRSASRFDRPGREEASGRMIQRNRCAEQTAAQDRRDRVSAAPARRGHRDLKDTPPPVARPS